jgi:uncharacterized protein (TIGR02217 family)
MTLAFDEIRFPDKVAYGASGGPVWNTNLVALVNGFEQRNQLLVNPRHRYNVATGIKQVDYYHDVLRFFLARRGRLRGFRFKDWADFSSSTSPKVAVTPFDQAIGTGVGPHQLVKAYADAISPWVRTIRKPVAGTVRVGVAGVEALSGGGTPWSINTTTGVLTFTGTPPVGAITAGFEFDVPCRFDTDELDGNHENWRAVVAQSIDLIEIRI